MTLKTCKCGNEIKEGDPAVWVCRRCGEVINDPYPLCDRCAEEVDINELGKYEKEGYMEARKCKCGEIIMIDDTEPIYCCQMCKKEMLDDGGQISISSDRMPTDHAPVGGVFDLCEGCRKKVVDYVMAGGKHEPAA